MKPIWRVGINMHNHFYWSAKKNRVAVYSLYSLYLWMLYGYFPFIAARGLDLNHPVDPWPIDLTCEALEVAQPVMVSGQ